MNETTLKPEHQPPSGITLPSWNPTKHDWTGSRRSRYLRVTGRLPDRQDGTRQWELSCTKCRRSFGATDEQLNDFRTVFCQCQ